MRLLRRAAQFESVQAVEAEAMRRAARIDANHVDVVKALRAIGASVANTSSIGQGFPDLVVGLAGRNILVEVKDGSKAPSERKLTPDQVEFKALWRGQWAVAHSPSEAVDVVLRYSRLGNPA